MPKKLIYIFLSLLLFNVSFADTTPPSTTRSLSPESPNGNESWYLNPVEVTLDATDLKSGVSEILYRVNSGNWEKRSFYQTLNLAPNPSFEENGLYKWELSINDGYGSAVQDYTVVHPNYGTSSAKIISTGMGWHGIHHINNFAVTEPYANMTASAWIKTEGVSQPAYFKVYIVYLDAYGNLVKNYVTQSGSVTGTTDWTKVWSSFVVPNEATIGVFIDTGLEGTGTVWVDAVNITRSQTQAQTTFYVSKDGLNTVDYYSTDHAGNTENINSFSIKIDQTPPQNWSSSRTIYDISDPEYILKVETNVQDLTSGLSDTTKEFQYMTDSEYGTYQILTSCSSPWNENSWTDLDTYPTVSGITSATLTTPKLSFCDIQWNLGKSVRFKAIDVAGNQSIKEYYINGAWIQTRGGGKTRANYGINMIAEAPENNSDGIIESGNHLVEFYSTQNNYTAKNTTKPPSTMTYNEFWNKTSNQAEITDLSTNSGIYFINSDFNITSLPSGFDSQEFNQVVFINGDLTIDTDIDIQNNSTISFIIKGDVKIGKNVEKVESSIIAEGDFYTAYDIADGETTQPLNLVGSFIAQQFYLQRNLLDNTMPSEHFTYNPKYITSMREYLGETQIEWIN